MDTCTCTPLCELWLGPRWQPHNVRACQAFFLSRKKPHLEVVHLHHLDGLSLGQLEDIVHHDEPDDGLRVGGMESGGDGFG